ncbi:Phage integrase, N-terminal SAM-like domain [Paraburkholderia steynii]|uniref:Phage integrase, N-terminal SAM-like domain n=1 Tax=Paraburkholderia steynii TaxID=1245441 RepID=A0A7Z7BFK1_9BURK|nr:Phage integrase, N-terminal SAM-like domain [Paraburkholderia steynii]
MRQRMIDDMHMRQLAPETQDIYLHIVREFARFLGRSPDTATVEDLRRYQLYLVDHGTSAVSLNHAITGLKFFFRVTLDRSELMSGATGRSRILDWYPSPNPFDAVPVPRDSTLRKALQSQSGHSMTLF